MTSLAEPEGQKYALNDCVMNTNPDHSWHKQEALIQDIVDSQRFGTKAYVLYFPHLKHCTNEIDQRRSDFGFFRIPAVNRDTVEISRQAREARN